MTNVAFLEFGSTSRQGSSHGGLHPEAFATSENYRHALATPGSIRKMQKLRRARTDLFGPDLFADPAWDMILEAYASHLEQKRQSITGLCDAAAVPATTALRWIANLEKKGLLVREQDPYDARRHWIRLSAAGLELMRQLARQSAGDQII